NPPAPLRERVPACPRWLEAVVARALARDPRARFRDGWALARALSSPEKVPPRRSAPLLFVVGGVTALGLVALAASRRRPAPGRAPVPPVRSAPPTAASWCERGRVRRMHEDFDGAIAAYDRAIELDPKRAEAWCGRGTARSYKRDFDAAI